MSESVAAVTREQRRDGAVIWRNRGWRVVDRRSPIVGWDYLYVVQERFLLMWWDVDFITSRDSAIRYGRAMVRAMEMFS